MGAYIFRRLLLVIPTLLGVMIINFTLTQFVPGGPIEQIIANMQGQGDVFATIAGGTGDAEFGAQAAGNDEYVGARGLPPEFIERLEKQFGFDKPPLVRFFNMMWDYMRFDFGESYFRSISVLDLVWEKDAGFYHAGPLVDNYRLCGVYPAGDTQGGERRIGF